MDARAPRWLDGRRLAAEEPLPEATGPGVFETVRAERGVPLLAAEHLARLARGAHALALPWPPPFDPLAALCAAARELAGAPAALRLSWTPPHLVLLARAAPPPPASATALLCAPGSIELPQPRGVKTTARLAYDQGRARALARGAFDALVRTRAGQLVEGTVTNLFVARSGELATPPLASGALPGIVRALVLTELERAPLQDENGRVWRACERALDARDLAAAEEVLLTNSLVRILGLGQILCAPGEPAPRADLPGAEGALARALQARVLRCEIASLPPGSPGPAPC